MQIRNINGSSYYIKGGTNTGLYKFKDDTALIIDPGLSSARGTRLSNLLMENGISPTHCITTHEHLDHYEAYTSLKENSPKCRFFCAKESRKFLENPELFYTYIYGAKPNSILLGNTSAKVFDFHIDSTLIDQEIVFNEERFVIYDLAGHSHGHSCVLTPDKVLYAGDALFDYQIMEKFEFPFIFDVEKFLSSMAILPHIDFEHCLISHSKKVYNKDRTIDLADINRKNTLKYLEQIHEILGSSTTREDVLMQLINRNSLRLDYKEYHYYYSTLGSMLTYLIDKGEVKFEIKDGKLYYFN